MMILGLGADGIAYTPSIDEARLSVHGRPMVTSVDGVNCWLMKGSSDSNESATTYLRSIGAITPTNTILGPVVFAAVSADGSPAYMNEVCVEALGWDIARSLIANIERQARKAA